MGVKSPMKLETGVAIGGFSASMMDVDAIYRTIANDGTRFEPYAITKIEDRKGKVLYHFDPASQPPIQVFSPETAALVRSGLQAVLTHGTGSAVNYMAPYAAGKTGTSDDSRDNWFTGFTRDLVTVTWVGGDGNSSLGEAASGASLALPVWKQFMDGAIAAGLPTTPWVTPDALTAVTIDLDYGNPVEQGVTALFYKNKVPKKSQASDDMKTLKQDKGSYRELKLGD
jgi:penicillin-binding protein 1A